MDGGNGAVAPGGATGAAAQNGAAELFDREKGEV